MMAYPFGRCYSGRYTRNGTIRIRSNTNITNLGWDNILLTKNKRLQINLYAYVSENPRNTEVTFNQSVAELRTQDGGTHESATMLEKSM